MPSISDLLAHTSRLTLPDAAVAFVTAGVPIFPCVPGEKRPLTAHGFRDASTDPDQISAWWGRWPAANIGIPTGPASGVDVVDVDIHGEESGFPALQRARRAGLIAPAWAGLVRSPSGGLHIYFPAAPEDGQSSWQVPRAHIDFRGAGGYIIASPSRITRPDGSTGVYELRATGVVDARPVDAARLREFLDPRPPIPSRPVPVRGLDADRLGRWVAGLGEGERNRGLFWAACRLAEAGTGPAETFAALGPAAEHIGLSTREVSATIRSAYRTTNPAPASSARPFTDSPRTRAPAATGRGL
ncbi:bifunctional DNA primase/polymerase [Pseudarthrobacter sp. J1738]|uniref:bifunctional DNA primase/polymerase n=1 Tax=Micrococcales TaxID=85006 RepID=UPI003B7C6624